MSRKITTWNLEAKDIGKVALACFLHSRSSLSLSFVFITSLSLSLSLSLYQLCRESTWPIGKRRESRLRYLGRRCRRSRGSADVHLNSAFSSAILARSRCHSRRHSFASCCDISSSGSLSLSLSLCFGGYKRKTRLHVYTTRRIRAGRRLWGRRLIEERSACEIVPASRDWIQEAEPSISPSRVVIRWVWPVAPWRQRGQGSSSDSAIGTRRKHSLPIFKPFSGHVWAIIANTDLLTLRLWQYLYLSLRLFSCIGCGLVRVTANARFLDENFIFNWLIIPMKRSPVQVPYFIRVQTYVDSSLSLLFKD